MKKLALLLLLVAMVCSTAMLGQTYSSVPYLDNFESGSLGAEWTTVAPGNTFVDNTTLGGPYEGTRLLRLDDGSEPGTNTKSATVHLLINPALNYTLEFFVKEYKDEENVEDGIFMYDTATTSYVKIFDFSPTAMSDGVWYKGSFSLNSLVSAAGLVMNDSLRLRFQTRDDREYDAGGGNEDGWGYDSIAVFETPALLPGTISGTDTICYADIATSDVILGSLEDASFGIGSTYQYNWQSSTNLLTWTNLQNTGTVSDTTIANPPLVTTFYRRCVTTDSGEGPLCTPPVMVVITSNITANIYGLGASYCKNDNPFTINGSPIGGTFTAVNAGLTDNGDGTATINPANATAGSRTITYTYTDPYGCSSVDNQAVTFNAVPNVVFNQLASSYLESDNTPVVLLATPVGGTYVGPGITNGSTFVPSNAGSTGLKEITYTYTDGNGCTDSKKDSTIINSSGSGGFSGLATDYCVNSGNVTITATYPNWAAAGFPSYYVAHPAIISSNQTQATYSPSCCGARVDNLQYVHYVRVEIFAGVYIYTPVTESIPAITVHALPNLTLYGLNSTYCMSYAATTLTTWNSVENKYVSGVYSGGGGGITGNQFLASDAGPGTYTVTVNYSDPWGCSSSTNKSTTVYSNPAPSIVGVNPGGYCVGDPTDTIVGLPVHGAMPPYGKFNILPNWGDDTLFFQASSAGTTQLIYYYYDVNWCFGTDTVNIVVYPKPNVSFSGLLKNTYCIDDSINVPLDGFPKSPPGVYSGTSIIDNGDGTALFQAPGVPVNTYDTITYTYTDGNGCSNVSTDIAFVKQLPYVEILGVDSEYCESVTLVPLYSNPFGLGSFSGPGVLGSNFNPSIPPVGPVQINYTYTDGDGCKNDTFFITKVNGLPVVSILGIDSAGGTVPSYCIDAPLDTLTGVPTDANGSFNLIPGLDTLTGMGFAVLNPGSVGFDTAVVKYTYIDTNQCVNSIKRNVLIRKLPVMDINNQDKTILCANQSAPDLMDVEPLPSTGISGVFLDKNGIPVDSNVQGLVVTGDGTIEMRPDLGMQDSLFTIYYQFTDNYTCVNVDSFQVKYRSLPIVEFIYLDSVYCIDETGNQLADTLSGSLGQIGSGWYTSTADGVTADGFYTPFKTKTLIDPVTFSVLDTVIYRFTNPEGCWWEDTNVTRVLDLPDVNFSISGFCRNDSIYFYDSTYVSPFDSIIYREWDFGNALDNDTNLVGKTKYTAPAVYNMNLSVLTREGCTNDWTYTDTIGEPPRVNFMWDNICFGDTIQMSDLSTAAAIDTLKTWQWDFGDTTTSLLSNPIHIYANLASYDIQLILTTRKGCMDSLTRTINIRPVVVVSDTTPYSEDFEVSNGGWFADGKIDTGLVISDTSSWERGIAGGTLINDASTANYSMVTNANAVYSTGEDSYIDGACFDISALKRPMIKFNKQAYLNKGIDGVNLQYSIDNGVTWNILGSYNGVEPSGIGWYDHTFIAARPGEEFMGWSNQIDSNWVEVRHALDEIDSAGRGDVRLRFYFGSTETTLPGDGFAFDNVWIGERTRNVLVEHFTNSSGANAITEDNFVDNLAAAYPQDVIDVQYHISDGYDKLNLDNQADPSARSFYYGVAESGRTVVDGTLNETTLALTSNKIDLRRLVDAEFDIQIDANINGGHSINVTPTITALKNMPLREVVVHIAVLDKNITDPSATGINGDNSFNSVMRQMLPDAVGTRLVQPWDSLDTHSYTEGWTFTNYAFSQSQWRVVVYVQDNITKEILQTAYLDEMDMSNSTGVGDQLVTTQFVLFPNPTNGDAFALFNEPVSSNDVTVQVYNQIGELVESIDVLKGANKLKINTSRYSNGMYYVKAVQNGDQKLLGVQKLTVQH